MLDVVRLDEAVLAHSGGHWLAPPAEVRWTAAHAAARDALLRASVDGRPALLKDPRMLLVLPFWRASAVPFRAIGIVRHPLAVARSLAAWREMPLDDGIALWTAHARALAADRARHEYPIVDFEQPKPAFVAAVAAEFPAVDERAYEPQLVHHDRGDAPVLPGLAEAEALYRELAGDHAHAARVQFPRGELAAFRDRLAAGDTRAALVQARTALANIADAAAVVVPVVTALVRVHAYADALVLIDEHAARLEGGLADLLRGKVLLAAGDAARALDHLEAACRVAEPLFQARHLLPQALRAAGRHAEARTALEHVAGAALYPHGPLATLAEWSWLDGDRVRALADMQRAIDAAPLHRRGRLRTRRAEWLLAGGDASTARAELLRAIDEDSGYARSRDVLAKVR